MRHRLQWFIHLRAQGPSKGDEHPTNTPREVWYSLGRLRLSVRAITFDCEMTFGLDTWYLDPIWVKFKGHSHKSKLGLLVWLKSESGVGKTSYGDVDKK